MIVLIAVGAIVLGWPVGSLAAPSQDVHDYALLADDELRVGALLVGRGDVGVNAGLLRAYGRVDAPDSTIAAGVVEIDARSRCARLLFSGHVDGSAGACGPGTPFTGPIVADLAAACGFPADFPLCSGADVQVGHGETRWLDPQSYGNVDLKGGGAGPATLVLGRGRYVFCGLRAARDVRIEVDGPAEVLVTGALALGQSTRVAPVAPPSSGELTVFVAGGPVSIGRGARVAATLCAPSSELRITGGAELTGTFVARAIRGGHRIRVSAASAPPTSTSSTTTTSTSVPTTSTTARPTTSTTAQTTTSTTMATTSTTRATTTTTSQTTTSTLGTTTSSTTTRATTSTSTTTTVSTTTSTGVTTTTTTSTVPTTTTTTRPAATCGNCVVESGETCDDCNTVDGDACPHNCVIASCTPVSGSTRLFAVSFTPPGGLAVAGITVLVDYPEGKVSIPGSGGATTVRTRILMLPAGAFGAPNDLDYALRESVALGSGSLTPGRLFEVNFDDCLGAVPPVANDFTCTVEHASDALGNAIDGATCAVTAP